MWLFRQLALLLGIGLVDASGRTLPPGTIEMDSCTETFANIDTSTWKTGHDSMAQLQNANIKKGGHKDQDEKLVATCTDDGTSCCFDPVLYCGSVKIGTKDISLVSAVFPNKEFCSDVKPCPPTHSCNHGICCPQKAKIEAKCPQGLEMEKPLLGGSKPCKRSNECSVAGSKCRDVMEDDLKKRFKGLNGEEKHCCAPVQQQQLAQVTDAATDSPSSPATPELTETTTAQKTDAPTPTSDAPTTTSQDTETTTAPITQQADSTTAASTDAIQPSTVVTQPITKAPTETTTVAAPPTEALATAPSTAGTTAASVTPSTAGQTDGATETAGASTGGASQTTGATGSTAQAADTTTAPVTVTAVPVPPQDVCPFGIQPLDRLKTCKGQDKCTAPNSLCVVNFDGKRRCCEVKPDFMCPGDQLPYVASGFKAIRETTGCTEDSVNHATKEICCQRLKYKLIAEEVDLFPSPPLTACDSNTDGKCKDDEFCGEGVLHKGTTLGQPKMCFKKPEYKGVKADSNINVGLVTCDDQDSDKLCKKDNQFCEAATVNGVTLTKTLMCFENQCPFERFPESNTPCTTHGGCTDSLCMKNVDGKKRCCGVDSTLLCPENQFPSVTAEGDRILPSQGSCPEGSEKHDTADVCCEKFKFKDFFPKASLFTEKASNGRPAICTKNEDCLAIPGTFCGESHLEQTRGNGPLKKHCFKRPELKGVKAVMKEKTKIGLETCSATVRCPKTKTQVCRSTQVGGKDVGMFCYENVCPFGILPSDPSSTCTDHGGCTNGRCVVTSNGNKQCCGVEPCFMCGDQFPYDKNGVVVKPPTCEDHSLKHPNKDVCCQQFKYKEIAGEVPLFASIPLTPCTKNSDQKCKTEEFCGEAVLHQMTQKGVEKKFFCFKKPELKGVKADAKSDVGLVTCTTGSPCKDSQVCDAPTVNGVVLTTKMCFDNQCPYNRMPDNLIDTCATHGDCSGTVGLCVKNVDGKKRCCGLDPSFLCPETQLPLLTAGEDAFLKEGKTCPVESEDHPVGSSKLCCEKFKYKDFAPKVSLIAEKDQTGKLLTCTKNKDCLSIPGTFCGASHLEETPTNGNPLKNHCFKIPEFENVKALLAKDDGLKFCDDVSDCGTKNPTICTAIKVGNEETEKKMCFERKCPYKVASTKSESCADQSKCSASLCVNVFQKEKHCCPVSQEIKEVCNGEFPYLKGTETCTVNSKDPSLCCPKFINKQLGDDDVFEPKDLTECTDAATCDGGYCADSKVQGFLSDSRWKERKHCYEKPVLKVGTLEKNAVFSNKNQLAQCNNAKECDSKKGASNVAICETVRLKESQKKAKICYEDSCPLWGSGPIKMTDIQVCPSDETCPNSKDGRQTHCFGVFGSIKHCCPTEEAKMCPGDVLPLLDEVNQKAKSGNCESDTFEFGPQKLCCPKPISKDYNEAGVKKDSVDETKECQTNKNCKEGTFCGESVMKKDGKDYVKAIKHCYPSPKGKGGIPRLADGFGLRLCDDHDGCLEGEYCKKKEGFAPEVYTKGICFIAQCPLSRGKLLPGIQKLTECSTTGPSAQACQQSDQQCHLVGDNTQGCCEVHNKCPGDLLPASIFPKKECDKTNYFPMVLNTDVNVCCHNAKSKSMKDNGDTVWKLAKTPEDMKKYLVDEKKATCEDGKFLDVSIPMDGKEFETEVKHCYPLPKSNGELVKYGEGLKMCTEHEACTGEREICDIEMYSKNAEGGMKKETSACAKFSCPLQNTFPFTYKVGSPKKEFCESESHCPALADCHTTSTLPSFKVCCEVEDQFLCPGKVIPKKYKNTLNHLDSQGGLTCDEGTTLIDNDKCCPNVISKDFYENGKDEVKPVDYSKTCEDHTICRDGFCGESMLEMDFGRGRELKGKEGKVHHCYPRPTCAGTTVIKPGKGLKTCTPSTGCGGNEICDNDLAGINSGTYAKTGVCCDFKCNGTALESFPLGTPWKSPQKCNCPAGETNTQAFCDKTIKSDIDTIRICEKIENLERYRLCEYKRDGVKTPAEAVEPVRKEGSLELVGCEHYVDCRRKAFQTHGMKDGQDQSSDSETAKVLETEMRALCLKPPGRNLTEGYKSICYKADLCSDWYTMRNKQKVCPADGKCTENGLCQKAVNGQNGDSHCCPNVTPNYADLVTIVSGDNPTEKYCTKLEDCIGERRFCEPVTKKCMYMGNIHEIKGATCTKEDTMCGNQREVCMSENLATSDNMDIKCYRHPRDQCTKNKDCPLKNYYCAPPTGTAVEDWDTAFRVCHPKPYNIEDKAELIINPNTAGLKTCEKQQDCDNEDASCVKDDSAAVKNGSSFCVNMEKRTCRGIARPTYENNKFKGCTINKDCQDDEFCDLETLPKNTGGRGICCSLPTDCDGEAVLEGTAGFKACTSTSECGKNNGEICKKEKDSDRTNGLIAKGTKLSDTLWKTGDGFCCKWTCPAFSHPEATGEILPAGEICDSSCKDTEDLLQHCQKNAPNSTYSRCCSYKRKTNENLCPLPYYKSPVRNGLDAKNCTTDEGCPEGAECNNGWCCNLDLCADRLTRKPDQHKCTVGGKNVTMECKQPEGGEVKCEAGRCCPRTNSAGTVKVPFRTRITCTTIDDCPKKRMFCHGKKKKYCAYMGTTNEFHTDKKCKKGKSTCELEKGEIGVCLYQTDEKKDPQCFINPFALKSTGPADEDDDSSKEKESFGMAKILSIVALIVLSIGIATFVFSIYYLWSKKQIKDKTEEAIRKEAAKVAAEKARKKKEAAEKKAKKAAADEALRQLTQGNGEEAGNANANAPLQVQFMTL